MHVPYFNFSQIDQELMSRGTAARLLTAWLGREVGRISAARTAKYFGRDTSTLTRGLPRLEKRMDAPLRRLSGRLAEELHR